MKHHAKARAFNFDAPYAREPEPVKPEPNSLRVVPPWEEVAEAVEAVGQTFDALEAPASAPPGAMPEWEDFPPEFLEGIEDPPTESCTAQGGVRGSGTVDHTSGPQSRSEGRQGASGITLRYYQERAIKAIFEEWKKGNNSTLLVLPTGCGKTITFGSVIRRYQDRFGPRPDGSPRRALVLAHRDELIKQAADSLAVLGVESSIEKADQKARASIFGPPTCVVASVQSMQSNERSKRLDTWDPDYFDLIVTDEGHHASGDPNKKKGKKKVAKPNTYQTIYRHFTGAKHKLFVTATPDRLDGENMGSVCDSLAYEYPMYDAVKEGYLCPIRVRWCDTGVDLSAIRTTGGDLNTNDIEEAIKPHIEELANATKKEIGDRKTLVFCPDVGSAEAFASAMESLGIPSAALSGGSSDEERASTLDAFRQGQIQLLANCALFTEGFDVPSISAIVLLRPTKSRSLYCQMVGRGTRIADGKENLIIVDFPWVAGKHKLVKPTELFDSTSKSEERYEVASKLLEAKVTDDLMAAMTQADEVIRERTKVRIKVNEKKVKYGKVEYDPLAVGDILGIPYRRESESALKKPITDRQLNILRKAKIVGAETMSARRASQYVEKILERWDSDKATIPMVSYLISLGDDPDVARERKFADASRRIGELKASKGQRT